MGLSDFSMPDATLAKCKKMNRYQRSQFWDSKSLTKLLLAIQQGYVPVGRDIRKMDFRVVDKTPIVPTSDS